MSNAAWMIIPDTDPPKYDWVIGTSSSEDVALSIVQYLQQIQDESYFFANVGLPLLDILQSNSLSNLTIAMQNFVSYFSRNSLIQNIYYTTTPVEPVVSGYSASNVEVTAIFYVPVFGNNVFTFYGGG